MGLVKFEEHFTFAHEGKEYKLYLLGDDGDGESGYGVELLDDETAIFSFDIPYERRDVWVNFMDFSYATMSAMQESIPTALYNNLGDLETYLESVLSQLLNNDIEVKHGTSV